MTREESPPTVCPLCSVGCRLERGPEDARAAGVAGPANPEGRLCRKGVGAFQPRAERLARPQVRRDGDLEPVDWETALEAVVERFERAREAGGPGALGFLGAPRCTTEENYLLGKLARTLGTNDVDNRARLCHDGVTGELAERVGWPATTNGLEGLREADVVLVAGADPAERQPVAFDSFVRPAVNGGATLVHLDPVGNRTTCLADVHLAPRPGTDAHLLDLLSAAVLEAGGADRAFLDRRTAGFEAFADGLRALDRERARRVAGVGADAVSRVADLIAGADRVAAMAGTGIEGGDGAAPAALVDLLLLTGNLGPRGTGLYVLRGLVNEQGAADAGCVPGRLPGHQPVTDAAARERVAAEWGVAPPAEPGRTATEMLEAFGDGIEAALVVGENPAVAKRSAEGVRRRLAALDALVVLEVAPSETTAHADVVLPAAAGTEKAGTVTNLDRRLQRLRPTADPPGAARPDFGILRELGRRLVGGGAFDHATPAAAFAELARVAPTHAGIDYAEADGEGVRWPADRGGALYRESFETADGRAALGTVRPLPAAVEEAGLRLVVGGRAGEFHVEDGAGEGRLRVHPADAAERGVADGDAVVVSNGEAAVAATAERDDSVRRGTVALPASVGDPLVRAGAATVQVEPAPGAAADTQGGRDAGKGVDADAVGAPDADADADAGTPGDADDPGAGAESGADAGRTPGPEDAG